MYDELCYSSEIMKYLHVKRLFFMTVSVFILFIYFLFLNYINLIKENKNYVKFENVSDDHDDG